MQEENEKVATEREARERDAEKKEAREAEAAAKDAKRLARKRRNVLEDPPRKRAKSADGPEPVEGEEGKAEELPKLTEETEEEKKAKEAAKQRELAEMERKDTIEDRERAMKHFEMKKLEEGRAYRRVGKQQIAMVGVKPLGTDRYDRTWWFFDATPGGLYIEWPEPIASTEADSVRSGAPSPASSEESVAAKATEGEQENKEVEGGKGVEKDDGKEKESEEGVLNGKK